MANLDLKDILGDLEVKEVESDWRSRSPITIWVPAEEKARYTRLQASTRRQFGKKAREALLALIDLAEEQAS